MAVAAARIQGELGQQRLAIVGKLADLGRVNGDHMGSKVAGIPLRVADCGFDQAGHMTGGALLWMGLQIEVLGFGKVAVDTGCLGRFLVCLAKLDNTGMGVMTIDTIKGGVLALEEVLVGLVMNYQTGWGGYIDYLTAGMASCTGSTIAIYRWLEGQRISGMEAARPVTAFALNAVESPGTD